MKKRICTAALVLSAAMLASQAGMAVSAYSLNMQYAYENDPFTVETETFRYSTGIRGMTLETDLTDANFMVTGKNSEHSYIITPINSKYESRGSFIPQEGVSYEVGDLIRFENYAVLESVPPIYLYYLQIDEDSAQEASVEYLGNALDIFGEDFMPVLRHELLIFGGKTVPLVQQKPQNITLIPGDITEDGKLNIMDVITLNKTLLGGRTSNSYQRLVSDADGDGEVTQADALLMMKYIVGLVESIGA